MKYKFRRKLRLLKNDPFGLKELYFKWMIRRCLEKGIDVHTKALKSYLNIVNSIGTPRTKQETELLKKVIKIYDETIMYLEENLKYARLYIKDESEGADNE